MPPKGKGKKGGKKDDDDEFWAKAGESAGPPNVSSGAGKKKDERSMDVVVDEEVQKTGGGFAGLDVAGGEDEEDDQDNLMAMLQKRKGKKRKEKKAERGGQEEEEAGPAPVVNGPTDVEMKPPKEMTAEELADEEFGPVKEKGKKKKGKDKKPSAAVPDEEETPEKTAKAKDTPSATATTATAATSPTPTPAPPPATPAAAADDSDGEGEGEGSKILSKKEKEKLKKEKEKAKKKAQAAAKKAQGGDDEAEPKEKPNEAPVADSAAAQENEEDGGDATTKKKKNRKKKGKKEEEEDDLLASAPAPTPAQTSGKGKKGPAGLSALKAALEEKRRLEEEAKRKAEEEKRRIEEEERLAAEEARKKEEEKQRRKEKEKAKKELARKEGRLLTDKQRKEKQAAEIRRLALLQSGAVIEGLTHKDEAGGATTSPKKVVYGKRKPRGPAGHTTPGSVAGSSTPGTPQIALQKELEPEPEVAPLVVQSTIPTIEDGASSDEEKVEKEEGLKDDWDASSEEDVKEKTETATEAAMKAEPTKAKAQAPATAPARKEPPTPKVDPVQTKAPVKPSSKAAPPPESSSEEESDSGSDEDDDSDESEDDSDSEDGLTVAKRKEAERKAAAAARRKAREEEARAAASKDNLRSPICCILGHVDTGKTKLLDKIRQTNVQEGEAGGITQQIGATYFPVEAIRTKTAVVNKDDSFEFKIPGLLIIDTPGHESFTNLRSRGSSLCNIAILVVDIMHGLEPQTIESLNLLKSGSTPFIIALNKIDRLYSWKAIPDNGVQDSLAKQNNAVQREFADRASKCILQIAEQGLNCELYWKNTNPRRVVNIVPTSAITGEGVPDMIKLLVDLTQTRMVNSLMYISTLECTVLEVKVVEGLGTTIDVILSNGYLREGDKIVLCGLNGPIVTQVRALLTPQPLRELRIKSAYVHNKEVKAANGVKVVASDLEKAIAGSKLLVCGPDDDEDDLIEEVMRPLEDLLKRVSKTQTGVHVQASTLGSLEALLSFLEASKIPVSGIQIGPVHKKDVKRAMTQLEKAQGMACILCFDVPVDKEAEKLAEESGVKLFKADIIYHLFDSFTAYHKEITEAKRRDAAPQAVWPCRLKIIAVFAKRDPIIVGVDILEGSLRVGTPLCVINAEKQVIKLGKITSLEINHKSMEIVKKSQAGGGVAVKIERAVYEAPKSYGRHFTETDELLSMVSRQSIDVLKETFRNDVSKEEWVLIKNLKAKLQIP